jgi:hypothetical protein
MQDTYQIPEDPTPEEIFRTWWTKLPFTEANEKRKQIRTLCDWDRNQWHNRLHGKSQLTGSERQVICRVAGSDLFTKQEAV